MSSIALTTGVPTYCDIAPNTSGSSSCFSFGGRGTTGVMVIRGMTSPSPATLTDSSGQVWTYRFTNRFSGLNLYDTYWPTDSQVFGYTVTFPSWTSRSFVMIAMYQGKWNYINSNFGDYAGQNYPFAECVNGQDCAYSWTEPIEADPGDLLIGLAHANSSGPGLAKPGFGYQIEFSDGIFALEDMITPVEGAYIGALTWKSYNGYDVGGSHWTMALAHYAK